MKCAPTTIDYRFPFTEERKKLIDSVMSRFYVPKRGLYLLFNDQDVDPKRKYDNMCYLPAYHANISSGKKGMGINLAPVVNEIWIQEKYSNLVFISKGVCERDDIELCWHLAHELRHLEQDLVSHDLSLGNGFLLQIHMSGVIETDEPKVELSIPFQLDAQLKAWRVVRQVFGKKEADCFVQAKSKTAQGEHLFKYLVKKDPEASYDVIGETIKMLLKYGNRIENARKAQKWNSWIDEFDIDQCCESLSKIAGSPNSDMMPLDYRLSLKRRNMTSKS